MAKNIQLIIGSTRQNRVGAQVAEWVKRHAEAHEGINVEVIDLKQENLPFFDAPTPPLYAPDSSAAGQAWAKKIERGDGFIFVTPEYNRGIPASLKNALDFLVAEWNHKPAAVVSYGWIDGVRRALDEDSFVQRFTPRKPRSNWSTVNIKRYKELDADGRIAPPGRAAFEKQAAVVRTAFRNLEPWR